MITRDIKADLIKKLAMIHSMVAAGDTTEAGYQLSDVIDSMASSMVSVTYSREESTSRPGDCENASDLVAMNID